MVIAISDIYSFPFSQNCHGSRDHWSTHEGIIAPHDDIPPHLLQYVRDSGSVCTYVQWNQYTT